MQRIRLAVSTSTEHRHCKYSKVVSVTAFQDEKEKYVCDHFLPLFTDILVDSSVTQHHLSDAANNRI